jgi:hypothetical protein
MYVDKDKTRHEDCIALPIRSVGFKTEHSRNLISKRNLDQIDSASKNKNSNVLFILNLDSSQCKQIICPMPIVNTCFNYEGTAILAYSSKGFVIVDNDLL